MNPFEFIEDLVDWFCHWRFNVCVTVGTALGIGALVVFEASAIGWILCAILVVASVVLGLLWEKNSH